MTDTTTRAPGTLAPPTAGRPQRLDSLTGLRFVAAFAVFIAHGHKMLDGRAAEATAWLTPGYVGVSFFFILSGFVLTWSARPGQSARDFYWRRVARIVPSHLATWIAVVPMSLILGLAFGAPLGYLLGIPLLQAWVPDQEYFYAGNGVAWSLSAEFFFYAMFPLILAPLIRGGRTLRTAVAIAAVCVVVGMAVAAHPHVPVAQLTGEEASSPWLWALYNFPLPRFAEFVLGVLLALAVRSGLRVPGFWFWAGAALAAFSACGLWPSTYGRSAITLLPFCGLIAAAACRDLTGTGTVFASRLMVRLGVWSFAFYLVHRMVLRVVDYALPPVESLVLTAVLLPIVLAATVGAAWLLHRIVEVPCNAFLLRRAPSARRVVPAPRSGAAA